MLASLTTTGLYFWLSEEPSSFPELLAFSELTAEILRDSRWALLNFIASTCVGVTRNSSMKNLLTTVSD